MKNKITTIIIIILLIPQMVFAEWKVVDDSIEFLDLNSWTVFGLYIPLVYQITNQIKVEEVDNAIKRVNRRYPIDFDFTVHIMNFQVAYTMVLGIAQDINNIILFDFLPYSSDVLVNDVVAHELGHLVYNRLSDADKDIYKLYRGISTNWDDNSEYKSRPSEIFAEDFRLLFGGSLAKTFEHSNKEVKSPNEIKGLRDLILNFEYKKSPN